MLAISGLAASPPSAVGAVAPKVVIIVGPMGSMTASLKDQAERLAATARSYGASVTRIYSPNATWGRVKREAQGAKLLVYMGHGNGWPSPYKPYQPYTKDGLGLNKSAYNGNSNLKYWGEYYVRRDLHLAANAVVILNHLCYASGSRNPVVPTPRSRWPSSASTTTARGSCGRVPRRSSPRRTTRSSTSSTACSRPTRP